MEIPDEVLVALRGLLSALERVRPAHVSRLRAIAREIQASLEARLKALAPGRYTTQEVRGKLAQVRAVVEVLGVEYGRRIGSEVEAVGRVASQIGRDGLVEQIRAWGPEFPEAARLLSRPREASDVLDPGLLEYYRVSRETYGIEAINRMKGSLAKAALEGKTIVQAWEDMAPAVDLPEWKAERIVRTEQSFASHRRQILDAIDAYGDDVEEIFAKQLVATFDNRTGEDSVRVHEQVRRLMEPFNDGKRDYQHPPNRPNDREVVVLVPLDEVEGELKGSSEAAQEVAGSQLRAVGGAAQGPRDRDWPINPGGVVRTPKEAIEVARKAGVECDEEVHLSSEADDAFRPDVFARYAGRRRMFPDDRVRWSDLLTKAKGRDTPVVSVVMRESLFASDEAIIAILAHEFHELNLLKRRMEGDRTLTVKEFYSLTSEGNEGNDHSKAWDYSNQVIKEWRAQHATSDKRSR